MSVAAIALLLVCGAGAGLLGALVGIGGGIVIVPLLVLGFGVDFKIAVATSLLAVVATSTAAGSVYVGKGLANMRLGMVLEITTTLGGISGGLLAVLMPTRVLAGIFSVMVVITAYLMYRGKDPHKSSDDEPKENQEKAPDEDGHEEKGRLQGSFYDPYHGKTIHYRAEHLPLGGAISFLAGILSGMLGVGGGFIKVPAMHLGMKLPMKVAAATSNFMIGVTAISSLFVYFAKGYVHPLFAAPVVLGVTVGALSGTRIGRHASPRLLQRILALVMLIIAVQMLFKALGVHLV